MNLFLQIFIYVDVFIIGVVFATALRHAYAHFRPHPEAAHNQAKPQVKPSLDKEMRTELLEESAAKYRQVLEKEATKLAGELEVTAERINTTVKKLAADVVTKELEGFQQLFKDYQASASAELEGTKDQTEAYKNQLKAKMEEQVEAEKQRLIELIDNRLSDLVMSFLIEAMQHEIDLGAQADYLMKTLEDHKNEFKQALNQ
jgi:uncharacterized protein YaaR (DUF327 family)